jgi:hypothetical protein
VPPSAVHRIVQVDEKRAFDVDQEHLILEIIRDAEHENIVAEPCPGIVGQYGYIEACAPEVVPDAAADMVWQKNFLAVKFFERLRV